ncbi:hypothetical protein ACFRJ3_29670 [Streptomyces sp. NPDC056696]|uniref:hypothetical protein n=1 Tax=Streptomyces sp. NPDC056696 TaxID=3345914 RepID=UPI0036CD41E3
MLVEDCGGLGLEVDDDDDGDGCDVVRDEVEVGGDSVPCDVASTATAPAPARIATSSISPARTGRGRVVEFRSMNVRRWEGTVAAWAVGDDQELDEAWADQIIDLGFQRGQCEYVANVGFAA